MKKFTLFFYTLLTVFISTIANGQKYFQNEPILLDFPISETAETALVNPFTDYRLQVEFKLGDTKFLVPGYYAADGNAAETSASSGGVWRVKFTPDQVGDWTYHISFRKGSNIAISKDLYSGEAIAEHNGREGTLQVLPHRNLNELFTDRGRLQHDSSGYFHTTDGQPILKMGTNSPENFLAYADIDNTYSYDPEKNYLKTWQPHVRDWRSGDPTWQNGKGKGIIGALNYLASKNMNAIYALTLNIEGDSKDVWPFLSHNRHDFLRYDVSKLAQWDIVFSHAERLGIIIQLVTQEKENELILDDGNTGLERKLYYRELIARFAHHKNIIWNMGEENGAAPWWPHAQNDQQRYAMIRHIKDADPYKNPVVIHTLPEEDMREPVLKNLIGYEKLDGISMQIGTVTNIHQDIKKWLSLSHKSEKPWIISMDEIGPWHTGTPSDADNTRIDTLRSEVLWSTLTAGGAGVEWYFGWLKPPNDLNAENLRSRDKMWDQSAIAHEFFKKIPYSIMKSADSLLRDTTNYCFSKPGEIYVVYLKNGEATSLDLRGQAGKFDVLWYDPRNGGAMLKGTKSILTGGSWTDLGRAPKLENKDWVVLVKKK